MRGSVPRLPIVALVLLAVAGMVLQSGSVPHLHADPEAGVYNADHDLTLLAALAGHVVQVDAVPLAPDTVSIPLAPGVPERPAARVARAGGSRAPPAA